MLTLVTLDSLAEEVSLSDGFILFDVGLYLDGPSGTTRAIRDGLYKGVLNVGIIPADPVTLTDPDVSGLTGAARLRVLAVAQLHCCRLALPRWYQAMRTQGAAAFSKPDEVAAGWIPEERKGLLARIAQLEAEVATPFAQPDADPAASVNAPPVLPCHPYPYLGGCPCGYDYP